MNNHNFTPDDAAALTPETGAATVTYLKGLKDEKVRFESIYELGRRLVLASMENQTHVYHYLSKHENDLFNNKVDLSPGEAMKYSTALSSFFLD